MFGAREKCPAADAYVSDLCAPELRRPKYDLVLCCDVISSVGLARCRDGLRAIVNRLAPGGLLLLHVPACPRLFGAHDAAVGTVERDRPDEIRSLLDELGLVPQIFGYRMARLFPAVAAVRLARRCRAIQRKAPPRSDLRATGRIGSRVSARSRWAKISPPRVASVGPSAARWWPLHVESSRHALRAVAR